MVTAMYPGSFDPVTLGHVDIALRAAGIFDRLIVAVYDQPSKDLMFSTQERVELFSQVSGAPAQCRGWGVHGPRGGVCPAGRGQGHRQGPEKRV